MAAYSSPARSGKNHLDRPNLGGSCPPAATARPNAPCRQSWMHGTTSEAIWEILRRSSIEVGARPYPTAELFLPWMLPRDGRPHSPGSLNGSTPSSMLSDRPCGRSVGRSLSMTRREVDEKHQLKLRLQICVTSIKQTRFRDGDIGRTELRPSLRAT